MIPDDIPQQERLVRVAAAITILLGLVFVFVRAPHPFGWEGIDHYHDLALRLAHGESFPTTDIPWGYAYFLALFYRVAGDRPWVPLCGQVLLNGFVPVLLYRLVRHVLGGRTATLAALLASVFSFNTIYASTQSSDSVCTVIFLAGLASFASALRADSLSRGAAGGLLAGAASQFRPNLILFPIVLAVVAFFAASRTPRRARLLTVYVAFAGAVSIPWIARNYRLTGELIPTSTHGGVQLWYGSLQTGAYLNSRAHNPRAFFEPAAFDYTSLAGRPLLVESSRPCDESPATLTYWTDRDNRHRSAERAPDPDRRTIAFVLPEQPARTALYFFFAVTRPDGGVTTTPPGGANDPFVFFVDDRHLEDLDRQDDLLDAFDLVRTLRAIGFNEPVNTRVADLTHDGRVDDRDLQAMVAVLLTDERIAPNPSVFGSVVIEPDAVGVRLADGSTFTVPRAWSGRITDVSATAGLAARLCYTRRRLRSLETSAAPADTCRALEAVRVNEVFYLREPHWLRRHTALALDNIRRAPLAFVAASAYRAVRLFVVQGTSDSSTTWQFAGSRMVYALAAIASLSYMVAGAAGVIVALRRRQRVWLLLAPILYIPATICFVLTNMRYTITVQPLILAFVAVALTAAAEAAGLSGTRTASRPS